MKKLYAIFDLIARAYFPPFVFPHDAVAVRAFQDSLQDAKSPWSSHPQDFDLHCLGEFADSYGEDEHPVVPIVGKPWRVVVTGAACAATLSAGPQLAREA